MSMSNREKDVIKEVTLATLKLLNKVSEVNGFMVNCDDEDCIMKEKYLKAHLIENKVERLDEIMRLTKEDNQRIKLRLIQEEKLRDEQISVINEFMSAQSRVDRLMRLEKPFIKDIGSMSMDTFRTMTKKLFKDILPSYCEYCGARENLHIHHVRYVHPIRMKDLIRLCSRCHRKLELKLSKGILTPDTTPLPIRNMSDTPTPLFPVEVEK